MGRRSYLASGSGLPWPHRSSAGGEHAAGEAKLLACRAVAMGDPLSVPLALGAPPDGQQDYGFT